MIETPDGRDLRLLKQIFGREIDSFSIHSGPPCPEKDLRALHALKNEGFISAFESENGNGFPIQFLNVEVTIKGRTHLEDLEQKIGNKISLTAENEILNRQVEEMKKVPHTLLSYWKFAKPAERLGMVFVFLLVFLVGYLCAKNRFISSIIDLIRSMKP